MMSEHRYGVHDCPNMLYYLRDVTDHSVYIHRNYGYLYSPYKDDIELVSELLNELADKVDERQATINKLKEENERLKQQLLYEGDDVCSICKHEYLVPKGKYFIGKCKKEHEECSKKDIKYCEDFQIIQADFEDLIKRMDKEFKE